MNFDSLAKSGTEHAHQRAFFAWLALAAYNGFEGAKVLSDGGTFQRAHRASPLPELHLMHAIPNGGARDKITAGKLKAEGVKAGVLDTFLPVPKSYTTGQRVHAVHEVTGETLVDIKPDDVYWYMGLYIEFKEPKRKTHKDGGLSQAQMDFSDAVMNQGYCVRVAYTWREAANLVMAYYGVDVRFET